MGRNSWFHSAFCPHDSGFTWYHFKGKSHYWRVKIVARFQRACPLSLRENKNSPYPARLCSYLSSSLPTLHPFFQAVTTSDIFFWPSSEVTLAGHYLLLCRKPRKQLIEVSFSNSRCAEPSCCEPFVPLSPEISNRLICEWRGQWDEPKTPHGGEGVKGVEWNG